MIEPTETLQDQPDLHLVTRPVDPRQIDLCTLCLFERTLGVAHVEKDQRQARPYLTSTLAQSGSVSDVQPFSQGLICCGQIVELAGGKPERPPCHSGGLGFEILPCDQLFCFIPGFLRMILDGIHEP